jgi:hypothetical protein
LVPSSVGDSSQSSLNTSPNVFEHEMSSPVSPGNVEVSAALNAVAIEHPGAAEELSPMGQDPSPINAEPNVAASGGDSVPATPPSAVSELQPGTPPATVTAAEPPVAAGPAAGPTPTVEDTPTSNAPAGANTTLNNNHSIPDSTVVSATTTTSDVSDSRARPPPSSRATRSTDKATSEAAAAAEAEVKKFYYLPWWWFKESLGLVFADHFKQFQLAFEAADTKKVSC